MSKAYLQFHALTRSPFSGDPRGKAVLGTKSLRDALGTIRRGLASGSGRICVSGGPGLGKTSLARALPKLLEGEARVALILDPTRPWDSLRPSLTEQWQLGPNGLARRELVEAAGDVRLVLVVDRAECAGAEWLDHLDVLLSYRNAAGDPVVQSVLFADLQHAGAEAIAPLVWWLDRIHTLQLEFPALPRDAVTPYIEKHLARAGGHGETHFTRDASLAIHEHTGGVPGEVGRVCEALLQTAALRSTHRIDADFVHTVLEGRMHSGSPLRIEDDFEARFLADGADGASGVNFLPEGPDTGEEEEEKPLTEHDASGLRADGRLQSFPSREDEDEFPSTFWDLPSAAELRALRWQRLRGPVAIVGAVLLGLGLLLLSVTGGSDSRSQIEPTDAAAARPAPASPSAEAPRPAVLGRLRGPVTRPPEGDARSDR